MVPRKAKQRRRFSLLRLPLIRQETNNLPAFLFPFSDSIQLHDCSSSQRDCLVADLSSSALALERAVQGGTHANQALSWSRWIKYCKSISLDSDIFLDRLSQENRHIIIGAFALALQDGWFSKSTSTTLGITTVWGSIDHVIAIFRENDRRNTTLDADGRLSWTLARQFRAYT